MKIYYVILSLLILTASQSFGQKARAELIFKDGSLLEGIAEPIHSYNIKFKKDHNAKKQYFSFEEVDTLKVYYDFEPTVYVLVKIKDGYVPKVLELVCAGKNAVYYRNILPGKTLPVAIPSNDGGSIMIGGGISRGTHSYVRKTNEEEAIHLASSNWISKNFKNTASNFFSDCTELVEKIQNREFKKRDLNEIIEFYNTKCLTTKKIEL